MTIFGISEKGKYRKDNQDAILMKKDGASGLFLVADGVGGISHGAFVSRYIVSGYSGWWENEFLRRQQEAFQPLFEQIKQLAEQLNQEICARYGAGKSGSTIALLFIHKGIYGYLSAGDSRIYCCDRNGPRKLTRDDTWENLPGRDENPLYNGKIVSAVGGYEKLEYSCATGRTHRGEIFMLCSDGIYKYVEPGELADCLQKAYARFSLKREALDWLVEKAVLHDTRDNYSAVLLKLSFFTFMEKSRTDMP